MMPGPPASPRRPPTWRNVSISSRRNGFVTACARQVVRCLPLRVRDAGREQPVGDRLGVHVGEPVGVEVVDERLPERLHQLASPGRPRSRSSSTRLIRSRMRAGQLGEPLGELLRGRDDLAVAQLEGRAPPLAPCLVVALVLGAATRGCSTSCSAAWSRCSGVSRSSQASTLSVGRSFLPRVLREVGEADPRSSPSP